MDNFTTPEPVYPRQAEFNALKTNINDFFLLTMGVIVYFMQCGFAFLEAGAVRTKNVTNILAKNILDSFVGGIAYWIFGFAFAFGPGNGFIGYNYFALAQLPDDKLSFWFFQFVFAATATTIVSGALAERCDFISYLTYSIIITGFVYPVVSHWTWHSDGWLNNGITNNGIHSVYQDFAGSSVVHCTGGIAALVGALFLGPRIGRFNEDGSINGLKGHSVPLACLGGFILFFGFFGFNGGSQTSIAALGDGTIVAMAFVNTIISASFAAVVILASSRIFGQNWSLLSTINGALAGMVAICAGCNCVAPWGAALIGFVAGLTYLLWSRMMLKLKVDDPLDAVAVHLGGGSWGIMSVPFLNRERGILIKWDRQSGQDLGWQFAGFLVLIIWVAICSIIIFGCLRLLKVLRVSAEMEMKGLDIPKHGEPAYPMSAYGHGWKDEDFRDKATPRIAKIASHTDVLQLKRSRDPQINESKVEVYPMQERNKGVDGPYDERDPPEEGVTSKTGNNG